MLLWWFSSCTDREISTNKEIMFIYRWTAAQSVWSEYEINRFQYC